MLTTGSKRFDNLLFGLLGEANIEDGLKKARERVDNLKESQELEEIILSNGEFLCMSNNKKVKATIVGLASIATPVGYIYDESVSKEIKKYRDSLFRNANAYIKSLPAFFNNTRPVGNCLAEKGDYMCIAVLYCKI